MYMQPRKFHSLTVLDFVWGRDTMHSWRQIERFTYISCRMLWLHIYLLLCLYISYQLWETLLLLVYTAASSFRLAYQTCNKLLAPPHPTSPLFYLKQGIFRTQLVYI